MAPPGPGSGAIEVLGIAHAVTILDRSVFLAINHGIQSPLLDRTMPAVTDLGLGYVQALAVLLVAVAVGARAGEVGLRTFLGDAGRAIYRRRAWVGPMLAALALSGFGSDAIKGCVSRHRPWWFYEKEHAAGRFLDVHVRTVPGVYPLKVHGFPSGHTATSVAMASVVTILFWRRRGRRWLVGSVWALTAAIAFSRIYLASHWPLDLVGAAAIGAVSAPLAVHICAAWARRRAPATHDREREDRMTSARGSQSGTSDASAPSDASGSAEA